MLLAGGDSTRIWPIQYKLLVTFFGQPIILHSLNQLYRKGIRNFIIVSSRENKNVYQGLNFPKEAKVKIVVQKDQTGMAGAILSAAAEIAGKKILVVGPGDIVEDYLIEEFGQLYKRDPEAAMVGKHLEEYFPGGYLKEENGIITGIIEKPKPEDRIGNLVNIVMDYWRSSSALLEALNEVEPFGDDRYERAKEILIKKGTVIKLLPYNGYWGFLKYPWHLLSINDYFLAGIKKNYGKVKISESACLSGEIILEDGVTILENAKIVGPAYIGRNSLIGQNTLIRNSHIGEGAIVGFATEIVRSYVSANCWFHHNFIGDSVIMDNTSLGAGAILANYRLDGGVIKSKVNKQSVSTGKTKLGAVIGRNCRIGVNSSLMPGVKVGSDCFIGSGITLDSDLADGQFASFKKGSYTVEKNKIKLPNNAMQKNLRALKY
ncbi:hypothetical protein A2781_01360 [Candidatus Gottesmanbacteria bacterium RIFCSPHIGHO2_01_FULL_42_27]|uniref:Nucleotidyl transferase domain-containing protein n=2 Tax=Candidatus Gottesmaniibacteriota TaxID=1752720 RepID=A0A1F6BGA7_9BACT|nr:MAG: Glucose-1-phosphate thymidylyltransferase-like protein [Candidatus Gottesmanbacteria bacterium GW2011_GWA2_42_18]OGG10933.1 MAG: hypothetical protein A2781_01360 [Candidatus Gottesmanbacteria bacterium RIFCSPHIGHO2_01_FULL_42_27]OGG19366.1 MAG: hypothetical protein A3E72_02310 [Candidatus Gottesmanbacteria bacterium RIFCSPHIGHO2_12_FULL_43_26]OGG34272.1 MAG: hypothetical protein A3G68_05240 [Candidatus Gottesmanbacteria bacterium RIFCSPLOWO2_12_FULL_42_10]OGG35843.1 MAG: hypothetical pr